MAAAALALRKLWRVMKAIAKVRRTYRKVVIRVSYLAHLAPVVAVVAAIQSFHMLTALHHSTGRSGLDSSGKPHH